jgi:TldD protein
MKNNQTRRDFLKVAGSGLITISASSLILDILTKRADLCLAEELSEFSTENQGVPKYVIDKALKLALADGADFADIYIERTIKRIIVMKENSIKNINYSVDMGAGIRVLYGESTGFAYCEDLSEGSIYKTAKLTASLGKSNKITIPRTLNKTLLKSNIISETIPISSITEDKRVLVMKQAEEAARSYDSKIKEVFIDYYDEFKQITIANSDGVFVDDVQPVIYFKVNALGIGNGTRHMGRSRISGRCGFELFDKNPPDKAGRMAAEEAVKMLSAVNSPSGEIPVVVNGGWGGVLFHEAVGHGLEADGVAKGSSYFTGRIGEKVASDIVTFVDDATIPNLRGSFNIDDEGTPSQRKILIDKGILKGYMSDILSSKKLKITSTGNGRRESFRCIPLVRMTNTFILEGKSKPEEIIAATKKGLFAKDFEGGVVDSTTENFTFTVREAYLIENGKITSPVKRTTLIGKGPDALQSIDMIADDLDYGPGTCGKGQWVPVTSGQPTLRLSKIVVGGTQI